MLRRMHFPMLPGKERNHEFGRLVNSVGLGLSGFACSERTQVAPPEYRRAAAWGNSRNHMQPWRYFVLEVLKIIIFSWPPPPSPGGSRGRVRTAICLRTS